MIEFGARLSLKDNMLSVMKKNLQMQREFSESVKQTSSSITELGKKKADPVISARDKATGIIGGIRKVLGITDTMVSSPEVSLDDLATEDLRQLKKEMERLNHVKLLTRVEVDDEASKKLEEIDEKMKELATKVVAPIIRLRDLTSSALGKIKQKLKEIAVNYTPIVRLRDLATQGISKIKNTLGGLGSKAFTAVVGLKDNATGGINKIRVSLRTVQKMVATPLIKAKDTATKVITKIKSGLKSISKVFAPIVKLKDEASKIASKIKQRIAEIKERHETKVSLKDGASAGIDAIKNGLKTLASGVVVAVTLKKVGDLTMAALNSGANLEQSVGGVQTLFKGDADAVMANAAKAYETAGLSANAYMEQVTSFSASLISSLGGDTTKAVSIADRAIVDMADNANKFGTDIESIQNAYQGFAKQNYTMLDNLKLGYGGTQEEMQRLISDAAKMTAVQEELGVTVDANSMDFANIANAISVVQKNMGVMGTTALEASETFSGSFASMKAAAQNLLGNMAIGGKRSIVCT